ncbi:MBL fold metallo-hydrolase [Algibacter sp. L1A34]|uniref:MBL fold metallo-hydrolase n=1 Tax=Algibacter sp. L1A34 TaxID=2686365 RepID=UPI00131B3AA8|nr:MBL fold metallo-hydrolase [Algibacter sp. L1A34]
MKLFKSILAIYILLINFSMYAQSKFDKVNIKTTPLSEHIYMLEGSGGNIGVSIGNDGVFIIDTQFAPLTPKILDAIKKLSNKPVKIVANTHHHGDHTGGNENLGNLGATIIAHENVRKRLLEQSPKLALPVITFNDKLNIQMNDEQVVIFHVENAHTDGDVMLYFTESNVLHTGDTFFNARYPYIDISSGGSVNGYINAVKSGLMFVDDDTKIIPGHGNLGNKTEYTTFLNMLETVKVAVLEEISKNKTEDEVAANTSITKIYDDLGYGDHFINSEKMRRTFYISLKE